MATVSHSQSISGAGISISTQPVLRTASGVIGLQEDLTVAQAGVLTTRTDNTIGTITMGSGAHTITTAAVIDLYWSGGVRYGVIVGTVATTSVPITGGAGDNLPTAETAVTVVVQKSVNIAIDGDEAKIIAIALETNTKSLRTACHIQLRDVGNAEIAEIDLITNVPQVWDLEGGSANPFTGNPITNAKVSQGNVTANEGYIIKIIGVQDASP